MPVSSNFEINMESSNDIEQKSVSLIVVEAQRNDMANIRHKLSVRRSAGKIGRFIPYSYSPIKLNADCSTLQELYAGSKI
jgi:hypothetical protein